MFSILKVGVSHSEIYDVDFPILNSEIVWFDITMHDSLSINLKVVQSLYYADYLNAYLTKRF